MDAGEQDAGSSSWLVQRRGVQPVVWTTKGATNDRAPRVLLESDEQWEEWSRAAGLTAGSVVRFCSDCLSSYRDAMISWVGASHPGTVFVIEQGGRLLNKPR